MRAAVMVAVIGLAAIGGGGAVAGAALAQAGEPGNGPGFGEHVSGMAPEHAATHGRMFGECVSAMATTGECPHHP